MLTFDRSIKIGLIIPDRGDRPKLTENCLRMMNVQTLKPAIIKHINVAPLSEACDITYRYRTGYQELSSKVENQTFDLDLIALIENDDWYAPNYLEYMVEQWVKKGKPEIFGTNYTIYYHLKLHKYFIFEHFDRASAMNTFVKPCLNIQWPKDEDPYTDLHLWRQLTGMAIKPERVISIGMKHGEGKSGGAWHTDELDRFDNEGRQFLFDTLDAESFSFYKNYFQ